jgi:hypothetical protein
MTGYLAAIFSATVFMFWLHLTEWRTASGMAARLHPESKPIVEVRRLRWVIRFEGWPQACRLCGFRSRSQQTRREKIVAARTILIQLAGPL